MKFPFTATTIAAFVFLGQPGDSRGMTITIAAGAGLTGNPAALAAMNRAAATWTARLTDPILVTINADLAALGAGIIGSTSSVILQAGYTTIRNQLVSDAANEADDGIVSFLPTSAGFTALVPAGATLSGSVAGTKANLKAMGFAGLDGSFGVSDASMTFSTVFTFDFDRGDGISPGATDFETVALHEIGHALGFVSDVDELDGGSSTATPYVLDLFRFSDNVAGQDPSTNAEFTTFPRNLRPGAAAITDDLSVERLMSTGVTNGDGRQASHWKDDALTGINIGSMDPTLAANTFMLATEADFRAFDLIGYEVAPGVIIPEPATGLLLLGGATLLRRRRSR